MNRLEKAAPFGDEFAARHPHLAFTEDDGTARAHDAALGDEDATARRDEARLHVKRHHRKIDVPPGSRAHCDIEKRAGDAPMRHADVVEVLRPKHETKQGPPVIRIEGSTPQYWAKGISAPKIGIISLLAHSR